MTDLCQDPYHKFKFKGRSNSLFDDPCPKCGGYRDSPQSIPEVVGDGKYGTIMGRAVHRFSGRPWGKGLPVTYIVCHRVKITGEIDLDAAGRPQVCCFRQVGDREPRAMTYQSDLLREIVLLSQR
jgi:hypothetical protein